MSAASLAVIAAALIAGASRYWLARLPEPPDPDPDKIPYAELARPPLLMPVLVSTAAMLAAFAGWQADTVLLPIWALLAGMAPVLAYIDARTHLLPYLMVAPLWIACWLLTVIVAVAAEDRSIVFAAALGNAAVFAVFWLFYLIAGRFFGGGFGYGDVRLSAVLGVVLGPLGPNAVFTGVYAGFVLAAVVGLALHRGRLRGQPATAFGPAMLLGAFAGLAL